MNKPKMKFAEWRPIGVCDDGPINQVKAKIFSEKDMEVIISSGVGRENWRSSPEVMNIIYRYAKDVAKMSSLTRHMKYPEVHKIQLVGTVLKYGKTPQLNRESQDGKAQFFKIHYKEGSRKKRQSTFPFKALLTVVSIACLTLIALWLLNNFQGGKEVAAPSSVTTLCNVRKASTGYSRHLKKAQQYLLDDLKGYQGQDKQQLKQQCLATYQSVKAQEKRLLSCYHAIDASPYAQTSLLTDRRVRGCLSHVCQQPGAHIKLLCNKL